MLIRLTKKHNQVLSLEESFGKDKDGNEVCLQDILANETDDIELDLEQLVLKEKLEKVLVDILPEREYQIICHRYGLKGLPARPQREVAQLLNISRSYISRLENKALLTIKEYLNKHPEVL